ncbi:hypothetical protein [uncultured Ruegeria sp.]|uniref:hypothetical protein n=1 Tax=uncultured Ruegeria sp. TaxID=259304 RepID=UPI002622971F|nr:hypothetical protein [uncultured Ruegeria sp.]
MKSTQLIVGIGLEGDHYALGKGHFQSEGRWGQALTLIESETFEALASEHGVVMAPVEARRNIVTRNIDLNALMGNDSALPAFCARDHGWLNLVPGCKGQRPRECCAALCIAGGCVPISWRMG